MRRPGFRRIRVALVLLVLVSVAVRSLAAFGVDAPWIAPDEMLYGLIGRSFWETGQMHLFGGAAPFYAYYPVVAGLPLAAFGPATGLAVLKVAQVVLVSLTALVVYAWSRRSVSQWWAFAAAAVTVALPALAYTGLMMTESVFFATMTVALSLLARALATPSRANQLVAAGALGLAAAVRLQGIGLYPAAVLAALLLAAFERDRRIVLRFWPFFVAAGGALVLVSFGRYAVGAVGGSFGAYGTVTNNGFSPINVLRWSFKEAGDLFLLVAGLPLLATFALAIDRVRKRAPDIHVSALLAVALGYVAVTVVQVGAFASQYVHELAERDLITVAPPLFVAFVVFLARGMPRSRMTAVVVLVVTIPAILLPMGEVSDRAVVNSFMIVPLLDLARRTSHSTVTYVWPVTAALAAVLLIASSRRLAPLLAGLVAVVLVAASVAAQRELDRNTRADRFDFFGQSSLRWIDQTVAEPVAYLDDGNTSGNSGWQQAYWNSRVRTIVTLARAGQGVQSADAVVTAEPDGRLLLADHKPLVQRLVVAPMPLTLIGRRVESIPQGGVESGLQLWRTTGAPTLSTRATGIGPGGGSAPLQLGRPIRVSVYACGRGFLSATFRSGGGAAAVRVSTGRLRAVRLVIKPLYSWHVWIAPPLDARGKAKCEFDIFPKAGVTWTNISYDRDPVSVGRLASAPHSGDGVSSTYAVLTRGAALPMPPGTPRLTAPKHTAK